MAKDKLLLYYYDHNSVLVVNPKGVIRKLYTPFRVLCVEEIQNSLKKNTWVFVDEVHKGRHDDLIFMIGGQAYSCRHFHILINF